MQSFINEINNIQLNISQILNRHPFVYKKQSYKDYISNKLKSHYPQWQKNSILDTPCPDIYAGKVCHGHVSNVWFDGDTRIKVIKRKLSTTRNRHLKTIVIVLESPHVDEYKNANFINPALKSTGVQLQKFFKNFIKEVAKQSPRIRQGQYRIILMESIPYQCSLGHVNGRKLDEKIRDFIFTVIWQRQDIKDDFLERLKFYNPDFIFNCCTLGKTVSPTLRKSVQDLIDLYHKSHLTTELYECSHPSRWDTDSNRKINKAPSYYF